MRDQESSEKERAEVLGEEKGTLEAKIADLETKLSEQAGTIQAKKEGKKALKVKMAE